MNGSAIRIGDRRIGPGEPALVVAELSANHAGRLERALELVRRAAECGAEAVKLQTYTPDTMTIDCDAAPFRIEDGGPWSGRTLYDLYEEAMTPWEWHGELKQTAEELGLLFFSTPFDSSAVDFLEELGVPAYKVASFELTDLALIRRMAATGRPLVVSTGMATLSEIATAVEAARDAGCEELVLLKCTSAYPAPPESMNLATIPHLARTFGVPVGLSDHTLGTTVAVASVALGACVVEKHFCASRAEGGPDAGFSMEPDELRALVREIRVVTAACGRDAYGPGHDETRNLRFRRSVFAVADVEPGEPFTRENVRVIRPGDGLDPASLQLVLGRRAARRVPRGTPLDWDLVGEPMAPRTEVDDGRS